MAFWTRKGIVAALTIVGAAASAAPVRADGTADELAALKRSNLRDYFEFDVRKAKQVARVGAVALRLKDADPKRHKFNLVLVVDDIEIEKKDKTLLEPVQFYRKGSRQIHEIVVYSVEKDRIVGYLSAPKAAEKATP